MPQKLSTVIAVICIAAWLVLAIVNLAAVVASARQKRHVSGVPLIGGLAGLIGFLMIPGLRWFCWLPPLLDIGTLMALYVLPELLAEMWQTSRWQRLAIYESRNDGGDVITLSLFKSGRFVLRESLTLDPRETGMLSRGTSGVWSEETDRLALNMEDGEAVLERGMDGWIVTRAAGSILKPGARLVAERRRH